MPKRPLCALPGFAMHAETGSWADGKPKSFGWCAIGGLIAVDQTEAWFAFVVLDIEADSTAVDQLRMTTWAHQLTGMGIGLALQEQLCNPALQRIDFGAVRLSGLS